MPDNRKSTWTWNAVWTLPGNLVATTSSDPIRLRDEQLQLDTELKRLVLEAERCPQNLRNIHLGVRPREYLRISKDMKGYGRIWKDIF